VAPAVGAGGLGRSTGAWLAISPKVGNKPAIVIVLLNQTYYHYCDIDSGTVDAFEAAESMGRYFNASIKGQFDCRTGYVPAYQ
jgi:hypothetical protein